MVLTIILGLVPVARAQETGQIAGAVTDPLGAMIPGAQVVVKNLGTNATRSVTTNAAGDYVITGLSPALYELSATGAGFNRFVSKVEVTVGGKLTVDVRLTVGEATTTVEVAADGIAQVNTTTQELSQVVSHDQISQLPSLTRNPYDFVALSGNVSSGDSSSPDSNGRGGGSQNSTNRGVGFSLNGQRSSGTEILLDGAENMSVFGDSVGIQVPVDAVQEYRVVTSNFGPEYGRASGGVVNVTTRTGTNAFHGTVWEFNRLSAYTANTVTNAQTGLPKGTYTRNQFGFAVGGPVLKDKLFFFGSGEWTRVRSSASLKGAIPTPQFLALSAPNVQDYFSKYGTNAPSKYISTVSAGAAGISGVPASTPAFGIVGYNAPADAGGGVPQNTYNLVGRVDYNFSNKTQMFFRWVDYNEIDQSGSVFNSPYAQYNVGESLKNSAYLLNVAHEFSPSLSSITKASFSRFNTSNSYNTALQNVPTLIVSSNAQIPGTSTNITLPGFYDTNPGNGGLPYGGPQNTVQINEDLSFVKGKHATQYGAQILYIQDNNAYGAYAQASETLGKNLPQGLQALQNGNLYQFQAAVNPNGALPCVKDPYSGALTQTPGCSINLPASAPSFARSDRFHDWAAYAQDTWKATPKLSVNYGVRYEYFGVQHNNNRSLDSNFFFGQGSSLAAQIRSGQVYTSPKSPIGGGLWKPQYGTVSPRVGFAYDVFGNGKTSFRAGYGISYERNFGNVTFNIIQNPPNYAVVVVNNTTVTSNNAGPLGGASGNVPLPPTSLRNVDQNIRTAQTQFWSAAIEQQLAPNTVVSLQYTGSRGLHLYDIKNYNGLGSGNAMLGDPVTDPKGRIDPSTGSVYQKLTRLNPQYSNINNRGSNGDSYYQGMNVQFQSTNLHHTGLSVVANYTYSHTLDDLSSTFSETSANSNAFNLGYTNPFNPALDRGNSDLDVRNRLVLAPMYRTPYFGGSKRSLRNEAFGGWQVTGIYTVRTGTPFTYYDSTNNDSGYNYVRYTPKGVVSQRTFKNPLSGTAGNLGGNTYVLGNLPDANSWGNPALLGYSDWGPYPATMTARNAFRGPGAWKFDASVSKAFQLTERFNMEFRAEGFNILNHHNLYLQESQFDVANGGNAILASKGGIGANNGANDERRFGQFALKLNF
ncbi:TonB-dependent receptor [Edaphobacter bradus]|uniref:TonB-dependent receptor n=1 Tax=Edaphobacter bradus TaxID=2259016 RepID=UPI0021DFE423|nr:carboxypeptidase regulatory-like domain-containing protein [Edaphobacter bradus]